MPGRFPFWIQLCTLDKSFLNESSASRDGITAEPYVFEIGPFVEGWREVLRLRNLAKVRNFLSSPLITSSPGRPLVRRLRKIPPLESESASVFDEFSMSNTTFSDRLDEYLHRLVHMGGCNSSEQCHEYGVMSL